MKKLKTWSKCIVGSKNLEPVEFCFLLGWIHYHNLEQWKTKLKTSLTIFDSGINLGHNMYNHDIINVSVI